MHPNHYVFGGSGNITLYTIDKERLAAEHYAESLFKGDLPWRFCHDDDEHLRFESDMPIFNGRDHNFKPLGTISPIRSLYPELEEKFHHPSYMVVLTKAEILAMISKVNETFGEEQYLAFNNDRLRDYLNAIEFDDNTIIVGLLNDGFDEEHYRDYY